MQIHVLSNTGICDCCDGSDEAINIFLTTPCPNNCEAIKSVYKKEALAQYRHIQAAMRAKKLGIEAFRQKKMKERRTYEQLLEEKEVSSYGMIYGYNINYLFILLLY